jgi:hypothetical protein
LALRHWAGTLPLGKVGLIRFRRHLAKGGYDGTHGRAAPEEETTTEFPVTLLCEALRVSRPGFYAWQRRPESKRAKQDRRLAVLVREAHELGRRYYGSPRVHRELAAQGVAVSRKRVVRLMQQEGLVGRARRRYKHTTDSDHDQPVAPNILDQKFEAAGPNQRWVGDTTELLVGQSGAKLYLAGILDLHSRFIVGWAVSAVNDRHLVLKTLEIFSRPVTT